MNEKRDIHMIGMAHLDPIWLWTIGEGLSEIRSTFRAALDRLDEFPEFIFTCSSAAYYEWLEVSDPETFARIQKYVKEGRWVLAGGWYIQPDVNIPCGESLARQSLYSQRYYLEKFGTICDVGHNVDSFGHSGMLPQILKKSGMKGYLFTRPRPFENDVIPQLFNWKSADGSVVKGLRMNFYGGLTEKFRTKPELLGEKVRDVRENAGPDEDLPRMRSYGIGNHGGGPTIAMIKEIERVRKLDPHIIYSSPSQFVKALGDAELPSWEDDLQPHAIGCYTANIQVKQQNRTTETDLLTAEALGALANMTLGLPQATERFHDAWKRVMFNQFHDVICGCSLRAAYEDATASYGYAKQIAREQMQLALQSIAAEIDTLGDDDLPSNKDGDFRLWGFATEKGAPVMLYNPLPFEVTVPFNFANVSERITDSKGRELLLQKIRNTVTSANPGYNFQYDTIAAVTLPPMGYETFWMHKGEHENVPDGELTAEKTVLENRYLRIQLDRRTGGIAQITDKQTGKTFLKAPGAVGVVLDERDSDTWSHRIFSYHKEVGTFRLKKFTVMENGPVRARIRAELVYGHSKIHQDYILDRDAKHVDVRLQIFWFEQHKVLKLRFPLKTEAQTYTTEIPYGTIERKQDGMERPLQRWLDVSDGKLGMSLCNDSNYAADVENNEIHMTVLRSPLYADHDGERNKKGLCDGYGDFTEQGERNVAFRVIPHGGDRVEAGTFAHAQMLNTPILSVYGSYHKGKLPQTMQGISVSDSDVTVTALKQAEDGGAYILRVQETAGKDTECTFSLPLIGRTWTAKVSHFEIKTFRIPYDAAEAVTETDLLEREL